MTRQFSILRRYREFLANQSGNFGIIFAICAFPAIGAASLALDYSNMSRERNMVQHSLDAAALATAKQMASGTTGAALEQYARDFFDANLPSSIAANRIDLDVTVKTEMVPNEDGEMVQQKTLGLDAKLDYDTFIATVMGQDQIEIGIASQVAMGNMTVEVALVIDNSGSMGSNSRMTLAKSTAKDLIETVYNAASFSNKPDPVKFSLVPFAASVNIGTNNQNQTWMDRNGWSPIHHENLNWNEYDTPNTVRSNRTGWQERINGSWKWRTRHDVYALMGASWQGCVEMRPWPYNTTDDIALLSNTSGYNRVRNNSSDDLKKQLFVPMFAPSEPYRYYTYTDSRGRMRTGYDWYSYGYNYTYDWKRSDNVTFESDASNRQANQNTRQDWIFRYQNNSLWGGVTYSGQGLNYGCTTNALTDLTKNQTTIENAVDAMQPNGNTNIQEGVAWGWRTLSPTEPFTEGRAYDDAENRKYMIVLTDGNNTYNTTSNPNGTYYGAWGYGKHGRIDEGLSNSDLAGTPYVGQNLNSYEKKMNAHTVQTCNNAKAAGVTVFTIAFDVRDGSSVKEMLNACAGSGVVDGEPVLSSGNFYFDVNGAGIQDAMASIASQISDMRIMK